MNRQALAELYDDDYAATYDQKFHLSPLARSDSEHEIEVLRKLLEPDGTWLDVECTTGYLLSKLPHIERTGISVSPAMLRVAAKANPNVPLVLHDFRDPIPHWDKWDLVSCMWYNYGLVDTVHELVMVVKNLWSWTAPGGRCLVPVADPRLVTGLKLPYHAPSPWDGRILVTGILWSYEEDEGRKIHSQMIAPNVEFMVELFQRCFETVEIIRYPPTFPGWEGRPALLASGKRLNILDTR